MKESIEAIKETFIQKIGTPWPETASLYQRSDDAIAQRIDHTMLKLETSSKHIEKLCDEAIRYSFFSVCMPLRYLPLAKKLTSGSLVKVCSVIGFPFGYLPTRSKTEEARYACDAGADELDMVICVGDLKAGDIHAVFDDIHAVREACPDSCLKVILECSELSADEMIQAAVLAILAGADFLKTSTGFASAGAQVDDIALLKSVAGKSAAIKASGGIRDLAYMRICMQAGADRIGSSSGVTIIEQLEKDI